MFYPCFFVKKVWLLIHFSYFCNVYSTPNNNVQTLPKFSIVLFLALSNVCVHEKDK